MAFCFCGVKKIRPSEGQTFDQSFFRHSLMKALRSSPFMPVASVLQVPISCCWAVLGLSPAAMLMLQAKDTTAKTTNFFMME